MSHARFFTSNKKLFEHQRAKRKVRRLPPVLPGVANELWYRRELLALVRKIVKATEEELRPVVSDLAAADAIAADRMPRRAAMALSRAKQRVGKVKNAESIAKAIVNKSDKTVSGRLAASLLKATNVNLKNVFAGNKALSAELQKATVANVDLIESIPDQYFAKVRKVIETGFEQGMRPETLIESIERIGQVTESRARLIARDQVSKMNAAFNQARQTAAGIERYEWQTAGDERVRPEHAAHDGKIYRWDDPPNDTGHPGEDINCRCVAVPIFDME